MWAASAEKAAAEPAWVKVAHALLTHGERTAELGQKDFWPLVVGLNGRSPSKNTCAKAVRGMEQRGLFMRRGPLRFGPGMGYVLGISLGTESLRAALFDANGAMVEVSAEIGAENGMDPAYHAAEAEPAPDQLAMSQAAILDRIAALAQRVALRAMADGEVLIRGRLPLLGVAVAWPTPLNRWTKIPTGRSLYDPRWRNVDERGTPPPGVERLVAQRLGLDPTRSHALNDANAVALAVAFDCCRRAESSDGRLGGTIMALRIGGGLGAGTVVIGSMPDGRPRSPFLIARLLEGAGGYAGELGHWQVPRQDLEKVFDASEAGLARLPKRRCSCGRKRCLERFASASAFVERMRLSGIAVEGLHEGKLRAKTSVMHEIMRNVEDRRQRGAQYDIGRFVGRSLSAPVLMLNPDHVTLSGSLAVNEVKAGIEREKKRWQHVHHDGLDLKLLGPTENKYAPARGAALAAFRGQLYRWFDDERLVLERVAVHLGRDQVLMWAPAHRSGEGTNFLRGLDPSGSEPVPSRTAIRFEGRKNAGSR